MTSATTWMSLRELSPRQHVLGLLDQRLLVRGTPPQGVELNPLLLDINLGTHQPMLPQWVHGKRPAQQLHLALRVAAPDKDQPPLGMGLQVQLPAAREGTPQRCRLDTCGGALPMRRHIASRLRLHAGQGVVVEPRPDLGLPQTIEALDGRLKARLS